VSVAETGRLFGVTMKIVMGEALTPLERQYLVALCSKIPETFGPQLLTLRAFVQNHNLTVILRESSSARGRLFKYLEKTLPTRTRGALAVFRLLNIPAPR